MYAGNGFGRRRPEGWAERRRYFRKLTAKAQPPAEDKAKEKSAEPSN